jgi:hypothetical protein
MNDRRMFGWDLPPGVTSRMIDDAYGDGDTRLLHCSNCGGFLTLAGQIREETEGELVKEIHFRICKKCGAETVDYYSLSEPDYDDAA